MDILESMDKNSVREFFSKGWITHDAMWYYHSIKECGPEIANKLNRSAVYSMAVIEMQRIKKLLGKGPAKSSFI